MTTDEAVLEATVAAMTRHNIVLGFLGDSVDRVDHWMKRAPDPRRFLPATFPSRATENVAAKVAELRRLAKERRIEAIGEVGTQYSGVAPNDPRLEPYFALAEDLGLPLLIHTAGLGAHLPAFRAALGSPLLLEDVVVKHPRLRIYFENAGYPSPGRAEVLVRSDVGERVLSTEVEPVARPPIAATHHTEVDRIAGPEVLFVGHANQDGWDHTAVAKPGIDRLVREFKARGHPVIYFVSHDYPFWYTEDRQPDLAVVSEGQEHQIVVDAERVVFSGGDFMVCTLRNAQMTLHGMLKAGDRERVHFVFPADAIWTGYGDPREYPAPMTLLDLRMSEWSSARERYEQLVAPFLDRLFGEFPTGGYPAIAPEPPLQELVDGWTVEVAIDNAFVQSWRSGDPDKLIRLDFLSSSAR